LASGTTTCSSRRGLGIHGFRRLKPGIAIEQARADMTRNLAAAYPDDVGISEPGSA
jgi:hypothetical protein